MAKRKVKKIPKVLTKKQIRALLEQFSGSSVAHKRNLLLTKTLVRTGARTNEILSMRYEDIILDDDERAFYHLQKAKNGKQIQIPLPDDIYKGIIDLSKLYKSDMSGFVFRPAQRNVPLSDSYLRRVYREAGEAIGLDFKLSPHKLRSTFASHLYGETGDIYLVSNLLNHSSVSVTEIYTKVFTASKRKAVDELEMY